jgi:enoyl-CoA hydratase/carnithine racemase
MDGAMIGNPLKIERRDNVAILTLTREDRRNALSRDTVQALAQAGAQLSKDPTLRAIVITGAGDRAFSAGADLKERAQMSDDEVRAQLVGYRTQLAWIDPSPVPVIAAINGVALGGGLELALRCDLRVAVAHAELGLPETTLGIIPGSEGTQRLPQLIGESRAKELILLGRRISAQEALHIGLIHRISPAGSDLLEDVWQWIAPIREGAPLAQAAALQAIDAARDLPLPAGSQREIELYEAVLSSEDRREALQAFSEKRKPKFQGR